MNEKVISIARVLLTKNIAFCIYRFPGESDYHLAIDPAYLPHSRGKIFWLAPFTNRSEARDIFLAVVRDEFLNEQFLQNLLPLPDAEEIDVQLPEETSREEYFLRINSFLKDIRSGKLEKAILSRVLHVNKPEGFNPLNGFMSLASDYPKTFVHLSVHPGSGMWMGATPELLLKKRDKNLWTMALAGTQARKDASEYQWRKKEMDEHQMLWSHTEKVFEDNGCVLVKRDGPKAMVSGKVAHLRTDYTFCEQGGMSVKKLLRELHPTPAVGGLPVDKGIDCIMEHEGYDRKYYCGFVGETDYENTADLYINLRCMQVGKDRIAIYAGGGITAASDPEDEWRETVMKSRTMIDKLNPVKELYQE